MRTPDGWRMVRSHGAWEHLREGLVGHGERDVLRRVIFGLTLGQRQNISVDLCPGCPIQRTIRRHLMARSSSFMMRMNI